MYLGNLEDGIIVCRIAHFLSGIQAPQWFTYNQEICIGYVVASIAGLTILPYLLESKTRTPHLTLRGR